VNDLAHLRAWPYVPDSCEGVPGGTGRGTEPSPCRSAFGYEEDAHEDVAHPIHAVTRIRVRVRVRVRRGGVHAKRQRDFTSVSFLIDRQGRVRGIHKGGRYAPGEADYDAIKRGIELLLAER
jgi:hypothetical protein